ncbi:hypothetical protein GRF59_10055 [Paenibacillus sp. HJL G12]|uniref:Beta-galactosidase trimerisation domain-containing protein n=1 Tax=Paenibacillus dendrobii TaxID=2691084 RepID=A0A7X3IHE2_9BACL|nr:hypothetical protein [Paenibacillus dendrobii]
MDVISPLSDFSHCDIIVAPVMYMLKPGVAHRIERFVEQGGSFVTTFFSGIVDENDLVTLGGYPGEIRKLLGIWVEETSDPEDRFLRELCMVLLDHHSIQAPIEAEAGVETYAARFFIDNVITEPCL